MADTINEKQGGAPYYPVLIIGAGASGIAAGCQLKQKLGFDQFKIVDRQSGIGGELYGCPSAAACADLSLQALGG